MSRSLNCLEAECTQSAELLEFGALSRMPQCWLFGNDEIVYSLLRNCAQSVSKFCIGLAIPLLLLKL